MFNSKKEILSRILSSAALYKKDFSGRDFMFIYAYGDRIFTFEASFYASHFKHLTGVASQNGAREFFDKAARQRLSESDFETGENSMSDLKLDALPEFLSKPIPSVNMLGEYDRNSKLELRTETLIGGVKSCMGFTRNDSDIFVPNTFLADDIRKITASIAQVLAVWRKKHSNNRIYTDEWRVNWRKIQKMKLGQHYNSLKSDRFKQ